MKSQHSYRVSCHETLSCEAIQREMLVIEFLNKLHTLKMLYIYVWCSKYFHINC